MHHNRMRRRQGSLLHGALPWMRKHRKGRRRQQNSGEQGSNERNQNRTMSQAGHGGTPLPISPALRSAAPKASIKERLKGALRFHGRMSRFRERCRKENPSPQLPANLLPMRLPLRSDAADPGTARARRRTPALRIGRYAHARMRTPQAPPVVADPPHPLRLRPIRQHPNGKAWARHARDRRNGSTGPDTSAEEQGGKSTSQVNPRWVQHLRGE